MGHGTDEAEGITAWTGATNIYITLAIVGCSTPGEVKELAMAGRNDNHMTAAERKEIIKPFLPRAKKLAFYRGSVFNAPGT
jgi:hypothetical protein